MKKLLITALIFCSATLYGQNATKTAEGNYVAAKHMVKDTTATSTGKTFTDSKANVYQVYVTAKGKLFVNRTSKTGNRYKQYLKVD